MLILPNFIYIIQYDIKNNIFKKVNFLYLIHFPMKTFKQFVINNIDNIIVFIICMYING